MTATRTGRTARTARVVAPGADEEGPAAEWHRLNPRLLLVNLGVLAAPAATFGVTVFLTGGRPSLQVLIALASFLLTCLVVATLSVLRLLTTRYRLTGDDRLEVRTGLLLRSRRSLHVDRIRSIDLTANPLHRLFGLTSLVIGTGAGGSGSGGATGAGGLSLDGLSTAEAAYIRTELVERRRRSAHGPHRTESPDGPLAALDWAWLRYAPLTVWGIGGVFAAVGTAYRTLHEMKVDPLQLGPVKDLFAYVEARFGSLPLWFAILLAALTVVAIGVVGSTATFIEGWGGYRLEREEGGPLRVRRGLLITRSVSLEESRLRGIELAEPMLLRLAGGARLNAVASGLGNADENRSRSRLTPPVPLAEAHRVALEVLPDPAPPLTSGLVPHPRAALSRRIHRALALVVLTVLLLAVPGLWLSPVLVHAGWITGLVLLPVALAHAYDARRSLGHAVEGPYLISRSGTFVRRTVALQRGGIIGWTLSRSPSQRRAGLLTLAATTAAGTGSYKIRDVGVSQGLALVEEAVPELLAPFLERVPGE
ncbi:PH domain-containing protein [Streptomyces sp. NPDC048442]|uniref:PH domain-containing protein n=1 Tax=Streptomyces sp. NPDC048442 TaxID=3154823 RepID=UPI003425DF29